MDAQTTPGIRADICEPDARPAVEAFLTLFETDRPSLEQIWAAMDFVWDTLGCDNRAPTEDMFARFYAHPVWLLNGLFIEQHEESLAHRRAFTEWVSGLSPARVADFGGGYGTLARMIGTRCPDTLVQIVDPYPRPEARRACAPFDNVAFVDELDGPYDVVIATDVFEHVPDALALLYEVLAHVRIGGCLLTANHFAPSIKCHLPRTFHFADTWPFFMALAGCRYDGGVRYGQAFTKLTETDMTRRVRGWERLSAASHRFTAPSRYRRAALRRAVGAARRLL
jgi:SAM-dependent methyltransferase